MHRSLIAFCAALLSIVITGCSMSSNKMFSWLKPKSDASNAASIEPQPGTSALAAGRADAGAGSAATGAATTQDVTAADQTAGGQNVAAKLTSGLGALPGAGLSGAGLSGAGLIATASAAKRLTPIQRELSEFQSFPFDIEMTDVSGRPIRLQDLRGKVVIVDVWGTWCGPCRKVIPHLVKLQQTHAQDLQVIGLCNERTNDTRAATASLTAAMAEFGINYPCILIDDKTTRKVPNFSGYPTMLFIDRSGKVRMTTVGVKPEAYWDSLIAELIAS